MSVFTRSWYGLLAIAMLTGSLGLLIRNAGSQEGHEEAKPIVLSEEATDDNPFEARKERERTEAKERERSERPTERDIPKQQVEVFKIALHALLEAEKKDAAEVLQRAIRAREVTLEERRDDEAHIIRERAPNREQLAEILTMAAGLWRELNNEDKAAAVGRVAEALARQPGEREGRRERERERPVRERREAEERERPRTEERPSELTRSRDQELEQAFVRAREAGKEDEAARIKRQMQELAQQAERRPARRPAATEAPRAPEEVERLKGTVRELNGQVSELRREMAEMRRRLEKLVEQKREDR